MYMAEYTEKYKNEILAKAEEIGVRKAAAEAGIAWQTVAKWKRDAAVEAVKKAVDEVSEAVAENKTDDMVAAEIEVKKTVRSTARKVMEAVDEAGEAARELETTVKAAVRDAAEGKLEIVIQSPMGGSITTDEIAARLPEGAQSVYVRVDENKLYWVKGDENGAVDIW